MSNIRIPFLDLARINQSFEPALTEAVRGVVDSGSYIRGQEVQKFEEAYALYTGSRNCVGVGNGFDALRLIFRAWVMSGVLKEGDEILVPANTYIASILAVSENRLRPIFIEPSPSTLNIDPTRLEAGLTSRTRALLAVHLYGRNAVTPEIKSFCEKHGLRIVEDNAQAAGCIGLGKRTGSLGHAAAHSFFPSKNLGALGDGGAVTTDDDALAGMIRTLGNYGSAQKGYNVLQGVNSRLDEIQAATLRVKLLRLDRDNQRRRQISTSYRQGIRNADIELPGAPAFGEEHVWHLFVVRCRWREQLQKYLADRNIEALVHYPVPPHHQTAYRHMSTLCLPLTESIHKEVLSLPLHPLLGDGEVNQIVDVVSKFSPER